MSIKINPQHCPENEGDICLGSTYSRNTQPYRCPVCLGRGFVEPGFYFLGGCSTTSASNETCRSCNGSGIIWQVQY